MVWRTEGVPEKQWPWSGLRTLWQPTPSEKEESSAMSNIKEGTKFEDLPDNWVCPLCGVGKDMFEKVEE